METVRIQNAQTEPIFVLMLDGEGNTLTGLTDVLLKIRRKSDGYFLDFNDNTFKNTGWVDIDQVMSEVDATNLQGVYKYDFDTTGFSDDEYQFEVTCASAENVPQYGELKVGSYVDNIDAAISSRSSHAAADIWSIGTRTLTSFGTLIADIWANVTRTLTAGTKDTEIDGIKAKTDNLPSDPTSETNATTNKNSIITEVDANETKIDTLLGRITAAVATALTKLADVAISGTEAAGSLFKLIYDRITGVVALDSTVAKEATLSTHDSDIKSRLDHASYGLSALQALLDAIDTSSELAARFDEIKGAGWTTETLKVIKDAIDVAGIKDWTTTEIEQIRDALGIDGTKVTSIGGKIQDIKTKTDNLPADTDADLSAIASDVTIIKKIETGRWKITGNQLILYDSDGVTPLYTFDLKDAGGNATEDNPKERVPV